MNKDFVDLLEEIKRGRTSFLVFYKGAIGKFEKPQEKEADPLKLLVQYIEKNNLRIWDLFKAYDKDNSLTVTRDEFRNGILVREQIHPGNTWVLERDGKPVLMVQLDCGRGSFRLPFMTTTSSSQKERVVRNELQSVIKPQKLSARNVFYDQGPIS